MSLSQVPAEAALDYAGERADLVGQLAPIFREQLAKDRLADVYAHLELPGIGTHTGHDALRVAYEGWKPRRPQRHLIVNTLVSEWSDTEAHAVSDMVFLRQGKDGWSVQLVGRYDDVLHNDGGTWRFHHRTAAFIEGPT